MNRSLDVKHVNQVSYRVQLACVYVQLSNTYPRKHVLIVPTTANSVITPPHVVLAVRDTPKIQLQVSVYRLFVDLRNI